MAKFDPNEQPIFDENEQPDPAQSHVALNADGQPVKGSGKLQAAEMDKRPLTLTPGAPDFWDKLATIPMGLASGATSRFHDEIGAAPRGQSMTADEIKAGYEGFREQSPYLFGASEIAGGIPAAFAAGGYKGAVALGSLAGIGDGEGVGGRALGAGLGGALGAGGQALGQWPAARQLVGQGTKALGYLGQGPQMAYEGIAEPIGRYAREAKHWLPAILKREGDAPLMPSAKLKGLATQAKDEIDPAVSPLLESAMAKLSTLKDKAWQSMTQEERTVAGEALGDVLSKRGFRNTSPEAVSQALASSMQKSPANSMGMTGRDIAELGLGNTPLKQARGLLNTMERTAPVSEHGPESSALMQQLRAFNQRAEAGEIDNAFQLNLPGKSSVVADAAKRASNESPWIADASKRADDTLRGRSAIKNTVGKLNPGLTNDLLFDAVDVAGAAGQKMVEGGKKLLAPGSVAGEWLQNPSVLWAASQSKGALGNAAKEALQSLQERGADSMKARLFSMQSEPAFRKAIMEENEKAESTPASD